MARIAGPMGRAYNYSDAEVCDIARAMGIDIDDNEPTQSVVRRINTRITHGMRNYLVSLRTFRNNCGFSEAVRMTYRVGTSGTTYIHVMDRRDNYASDL